MKHFTLLALILISCIACSNDADKICDIATQIADDNTLNPLEKSEQFTMQVASVSSTPVQNILGALASAPPDQHAAMWRAGLQQIKGSDFECAALAKIFPKPLAKGVGEKLPAPTVKAKPIEKPTEKLTEKAAEKYDPKAPKGSLGKKEIRDVIQAAKARTTYCYEQELVKNPNLAGKMTVNFIIGRSGVVVKSSLKEGATLQNDKVAACLLKVVDRLQFPKPKGNGIVNVNFPFVFQGK